MRGTLKFSEALEVSKENFPAIMSRFAFEITELCVE
jgi:hypothetical protein